MQLRSVRSNFTVSSDVTNGRSLAKFVPIDSIERAEMRRLAVVSFVFVVLALAWNKPAIANAEELDLSGTAISAPVKFTGDVAPYSWYGSTMNLVSTAFTASRYFDGSSLGIEMTCTSSMDGTFTVTLYKVANGQNVSMGSAYFKRIGFTKATWQGVGSGTYFFGFSKTFDGTRVSSSDVKMYSW